jgi:hypothetical protein
VQDIIQNKSATSGASSNYVVSSDNGTDSTYYGEFGINSSAFSSGTPSDFFSLNNGVYFSGHDGDIAVGSGNGYKLYFPWGATPNNAHVLNASGALGFTTNLGTTLANSGTVGFGTAGQALITAGSSAAPAWGNVASPYSGAPLFGTGSDGAVTISSGTTTLTRDMQYTNLTISSPGVIKTNNFNIFVSGTLDISAAGAAAINNNGNSGGNATTSTGASAGAATLGRILPPGAGASSGSTGTTTTGTVPGGNPLVVFLQGGNGAAGGTGGTSGTAQAGSAAGPLSTPTSIVSLSFAQITKNPWVITNTTTTAGLQSLGPASGGTGGGCGGGDAVNTGGGGGGGAAGGGFVTIYANVINRGTNTTASIIQSLGGNGGSATATLSGTAGGGGGGGGAGGGFVYIVAGTLQGSTITNAINVSGGTGGNGGNGASTGKGGNGGTGGNGGNYQILNLNASSFTVGSFNAAGTAGGTTSTSTGASGGAGATVQGNL